MLFSQYIFKSTFWSGPSRPKEITDKMRNYVLYKYNNTNTKLSSVDLLDFMCEHFLIGEITMFLKCANLERMTLELFQDLTLAKLGYNRFDNQTSEVANEAQQANSGYNVEGTFNKNTNTTNIDTLNKSNTQNLLDETAKLWRIEWANYYAFLDRLVYMLIETITFGTEGGYEW